MDYYDEYININTESDYIIGKLEKKHKDYIVNDIIVENNRGIVNDIVYVKDNKVVNIKERSNQYIAGILCMNSNKKYGFNSKGMAYYLFKPLNKKISCFYVASSLVVKEKYYAVVRYNKWERNSKCPYGICENVLGRIDIFENICDILLYRYDLQKKRFKIPMGKINKDLKELEDLQDMNKYNYEVYSIDPEGCRDIDDAIHFCKKESYYEIGVHITDVSYYIKNVKDLLNNVSSIYCLHKQINMIPDVYSTNICSLLEGTIRRAISVIYKYNFEGELIDYEYKFCKVKVKKNYTYEFIDNIIDTNVDNSGLNILELYKFLLKKDETIDSHKLVEYLMVLANKTVGEIIYKYNKEYCILRTHKESIKHYDIVKDNKSLSEFLRLRSFNSAIYEINTEDVEHYGLNEKYYTHFTSPIRRVVDIVNHINLKNIKNKKNLYEIEDDAMMYINNFNKNIKRMYFDNKIVEVLYKYDKNKYNSYCYILDFDYNRFVVYIEEFGIEYRFEYFSELLKDLYVVEQDNTSITIKFNSTTKVYKLYMKIDIEIYFIRTEDILEKKIKIKFLE